VLAVRRAAKKLQHFDLSDCEIYTTCEPCPMCLAALYWARIDKIYYGCTRLDAAEIGFDDDLIYRILAGRCNRERIETETIEREACLQVFKRWLEKSDRRLY
nr:nucleoside deaminase [bacterium]